MQLKLPLKQARLSPLAGLCLYAWLVYAVVGRYLYFPLSDLTLLSRSSKLIFIAFANLV